MGNVRAMAWAQGSRVNFLLRDPRSGQRHASEANAALPSPTRKESKGTGKPLSVSRWDKTKNPCKMFATWASCIAGNPGTSAGEMAMFFCPPYACVGGILTFIELAAFRDRLSTGVGGFILALRASSCWMTTRRFVRSLIGKSKGKRGPRGRRGMAQGECVIGLLISSLCLVLCKFPCDTGKSPTWCQTNDFGSPRGQPHAGEGEACSAGGLRPGFIAAMDRRILRGAISVAVSPRIFGRRSNRCDPRQSRDIPLCKILPASAANARSGSSPEGCLSQSRSGFSSRRATLP